MYQPKVEHTQRYEDSQGDHTVTVAKLMLVRSVIRDNNVYVGTTFYMPILISENEEIEETDWVYGKRDLHDHYQLFQISGRDEMSQRHNFYKVLALPKQFSHKHREAIEGRKIKDRDKVFVKCEHRNLQNNPMDNTNFQSFIHLDIQNQITLFRLNSDLEDAAHKNAKRYTKGFTGFAKKYSMSGYINGFKEGIQWYKKNKH